MRADVVLDRAHGLPRLDPAASVDSDSDDTGEPSTLSTRPSAATFTRNSWSADRHAVDRLRPVDGRDPARQRPAPAGC